MLADMCPQTCLDLNSSPWVNNCFRYNLIFSFQLKTIDSTIPGTICEEFLLVSLFKGIKGIKSMIVENSQVLKHLTLKVSVSKEEICHPISGDDGHATKRKKYIQKYKYV